MSSFPQPSSPAPRSLAHLLAGIAASGTFIALFFLTYLRGVPPLDTFILMLLGAGVMGLLGYQLGLVLGSVPVTLASSTEPAQESLSISAQDGPVRGAEDDGEVPASAFGNALPLPPNPDKEEEEDLEPLAFPTVSRPNTTP